MLSEQPRINLIAFFALILLAVLWGYSWIVMKDVLHYIGPFDFNALRFVLSGLLLLAILKCRHGRLKPPPFVLTLFIGLLQTFAMASFMQLALVYAGAGKIAIMVYTMPIWLLGLSAIFLKERLRPLQFVAIAFVVIGLMSILLFSKSDGSFVASLLAIGSGVSWAISAILIKMLYQRQPVDALSLTAWQMIYASPFLILLSLCMGGHHIEFVPMFWLYLAYSVVLASAFGWLIWVFVLKNMSASIAGLCTLAVPVIGFLLSWWLLGEEPSLSEKIGISFILFGLLLLNVRKRRKAV